MSVIFSIDSEASPVVKAAFVAFVSGLPLVGGFRQCLGVYKGQQENAFMMDTGDFNAFVKDSEWVKGQESFLYVASGNKQEATLHFPATGEKIGLGCMHNVEREKALALGDYTFRYPDENFPKGAFFVAMPGNPDEVE
jgi:hypothetical protein